MLLLAAASAAFLAAQPIDPHKLLTGLPIAFEPLRETAPAGFLQGSGNDRIDPAIRSLLAEASTLNFQALEVRAEDLAVPLGASGDMVAVGLTARVGNSDDDLIAATESYGEEVTAMHDGCLRLGTARSGRGARS